MTVIPTSYALSLRAQRVQSDTHRFSDPKSHPGAHRLVPVKQYTVAFLFCHVDLLAQIN